MEYEPNEFYGCGIRNQAQADAAQVLLDGDGSGGAVCAHIEALIEPVNPKTGNGRRPYDTSALIRTSFMQQC